VVIFRTRLFTPPLGDIKILSKFQISHSTNCSLPSDVSDRYNNLKASSDSLMEAASHGNPRSFYVAVTVVLEQLNREDLKRKNAESKK
jgi:hypothetical protein